MTFMTGASSKATLRASPRLAVFKLNAVVMESTASVLVLIDATTLMEPASTLRLTSDGATPTWPASSRANPVALKDSMVLSMVKDAITCVTTAGGVGGERADTMRTVPSKSVKWESSQGLAWRETHAL